MVPGADTAAIMAEADMAVATAVAETGFRLL